MLTHLLKSRTKKLIESKIRKALYHYNMISSNQNKLVVAVSGGKDSLMLLLFLHEISGRGLPLFKLYAAHIEGKFSCGSGINKTYLEKICSQKNIPLIIKKSPYNPIDPKCYPCSRIRRKLLFDITKELGATSIAFGHHKNDLTETIMMNLLHKGEFSGLLPKINMIRFGVTIIRPLIFVDESLIIKIAKENNFLRISCQCPIISLRKKIKILLKEIEKIIPSSKENITTAGLLYGSTKAQKIKK